MWRSAFFIWGAILCAAPSTMQASEPARLTYLSWFAGRWVDDTGGNLSEETGTAPSGDSIEGMWRYVDGGKTRIYELLTITSEEDGARLRAVDFPPPTLGGHACRRFFRFS